MYQDLKTIKILSSTLTQLSGVTRDLINYGNYNLYAIECSDTPSAKYILSNGQKLLLSESGAVISACPDCANITYKYIIKFSDIPIYKDSDSEMFKMDLTQMVENVLQT